MELVLETVKSKAIDAISDLPDSATFDDVFYKLYITQKIEQGIDDFDKSAVLTHKEVYSELSQWLD